MNHIIHLTPVDEYDVTLIRRATLGNSEAPETISDQVTLGRSEVIRITAAHPPASRGLLEYGQPDLDHEYYLVHLTCSFRPNRRRIESAKLSVALTTDCEPEPVLGDALDAEVWSMDPVVLSTPVKYTQTVSLAPSLKLVPALIELAQKTEHTKEYVGQDHHLIATGEGESIGEWSFRATAAVELIGTYRLLLVARASRGAHVIGEVALAARYQSRMGRLIQYRANLTRAQRIINISEARGLPS